MKFIAQEPKRSANIAKHGFDPAQFEEAFSFDRYATAPTRPSCTGRVRYLLIGTWFGAVVVVVIVSPLGTEAFDIVSVRRANRTERSIYEAL
ncbi:hypothetical protein MMSR116_23050 [Methylobacterium mesophilicum SR1.6/6]|uniref:BrnT family toxin n=1 Tax=Methylobacterium mesophilicum SR1.6/6 TaxID=908290 RepID=A0A6B9FTW5_9HYPH|nr:BrnT family toxin [Methylobacterium mesophilicum]QGY04464.1 hypothetical protein MMSR116_23050 [Methylobacterium mesophilicum SR1.6/6]